METKQLFLNVRRRQTERMLERFSKPGESRSDNQFIPISFSLFDNPDFRNGLMTKKRFRTYLWLRRHVVRGHKFGDPCDIFSNYWMNGKLAVSMKLDKIAKDLGLSKSTVSDHIRQLENDGIIGKLTDTHYSFSYVNDAVSLVRETVREFISRIKADGVDVLFLVPV